MTGPQFFQGLFEIAHEVSAVVPPRSAEKVYLHLLSEIGELGEEASIAAGELYKSPGADGVVGEAADVVNCLADLVWMQCRTLPSAGLAHSCEQISGWVGIADFDDHPAMPFATAKQRFARESSDLRNIFSMAEDRPGAMSSDQTHAAARLLRCVLELAKACDPDLTAKRFTAIYAEKCSKWRRKATAA